VGFYTFAIPLIHIMSGVSEESPLSIIKARMSEEVVFNGSGEFERVVLVGFERKSGGWVARPIMGDSSLLRTLVEADGFVIAPPRKTMLERDEEVDVNLVPGLSWA
jgi:molybdopterin biosynthesis enzyme